MRLLRAPVHGGFNATGGVGARSPASFDVDQSGRPDAAQSRIMALDLRRLSIIDMAAITIIVLSVAVLAFVGFSIWAEP
jgi:hypothetical protein